MIPLNLSLLKAWLTAEMASLYNRPPRPGKGVLMGAAIWGPRYIDHFRKWSLPSMLAPLNAQALAGWCRIVVYTDEASEPVLRAILDPLERSHGIQARTMIIPAAVMIHIGQHPDAKYAVMGVVQNVTVHEAGRSGMGFHALYPDTVVSAGFVGALRSKGETEQAIVQIGPSASIETAAAELRTFLGEDGTLAIADRDLGDICWRHLHPQMRMFVMNDAPADSYPEAHVVMWQGKDTLHIHSCHTDVAWLSPEVCSKAPVLLPMTLDAKLPWFLQGVDPYFPGATEGLTRIELSGADKAAGSGFVDFDCFAEACWRHVGFSDAYMPFFRVPTLVPIHEQSTFLDRAEILVQHADIVRGLKARKSHVMQRVLVEHCALPEGGLYAASAAELLERRVAA